MMSNGELSERLRNLKANVNSVMSNRSKKSYSTSNAKTNKSKDRIICPENLINVTEEVKYGDKNVKTIIRKEYYEIETSTSEEIEVV